MRFVLDANVALTWFLSEGEAQTAYSLLVARQIRAAGNLDIPHVRERVAA